MQGRGEGVLCSAKRWRGHVDSVGDTGGERDAVPSLRLGIAGLGAPSNLGLQKLLEALSLLPQSPPETP